MEDFYKHVKIFAEFVGRRIKIRVNDTYMRIRNDIALKWMKEEGYLHFEELQVLNQRVRDTLLDNNYQTCVVLILALLQSKR